MRIFVATDVTVFQLGNNIYAQEKHATILNRYYSAFGKIVLCARVLTINTHDRGFNDITQILDNVIAFDSLSEMLLGKYNNQIRQEMQNCNLVVARCPGLAAYRAADFAKKYQKPYLAESMGCAWDAYWNHGLIGKLAASYMFCKMRQTVYRADYALYVTEKFLQERYPCKNSSVSASNVLISALDTSVLNERLAKIKDEPIKEVTLMTTAAVDVKYKGQEYVIRAIKELNELGIRVKYRVVGEGNQDYLRSISEKCGVSNQVDFVGRLPLAEVFELIDKTDVYVQPSLQEGLPRSVIEAMSRGCVCIGAKTAGIPELLDPDFVVQRKSVVDIVSVVYRYCNMNAAERIAISKRNFAEAGKYTVDVLNKRRNDYYAKIIAEIGEKDARG